ncbi:TetR/AcrR family transcriptional regulator [Actinoalloteichus hymeniacidonis]|uniref:Transcriptional regulator, TetR family n=1 Tax=Actinoalloteichus hymeniacidonis TaxID=340345 RepID=A0AAC9HMN8_9PSEU|nr:TetR/AcrR family transcriptional regulator [Actinoalloteichus hymeniacidonis]AOS62157.1 transcriptional regulator, TetR family [Actinoalloteichus hymeniacidonis]MBB5909821.1 AcrR family transcriptional regulator [Actinoalloteichus hymeniacidonis]
MSEATSSAPARDVSRGRIDKRQAILSAAFTVFAREGYAQAGVSVIAAEAGVAKPTVYSHFGDKENLFRATITAEADRALATNLAVVERLMDRGQDLSTLLAEVGYDLVECYCDERSWAVRRLVYAELPQHLELVDIVRGRAADRVTEALADRLARLSLAGRLRRCDPVEAAEQLSALLTGSLESRARFGTRSVPDPEKRALVAAAVRTFLHAYGPEPA